MQTQLASGNRPGERAARNSQSLCRVRNTDKFAFHMRQHYHSVLVYVNHNHNGEDEMTPMRAARNAAKLTAIQLADVAGTTEDRVYQIERGRFRPRPDEARRLALALGTDTDHLFPTSREL
jgi:DNA-binding XRE family transcriptional regulator